MLILLRNYNVTERVVILYGCLIFCVHLLILNSSIAWIRNFIRLCLPALHIQWIIFLINNVYITV